MLQFHWTLSLTLMVTLAGEKKSSPTVTEVVAARAAGEMPPAMTNRPAKRGNNHCGLKYPVVFIIVCSRSEATSEMYEPEVWFRGLLFVAPEKPNSHQ